MAPPPSQNTVEVCNQITLLFLYYTGSKLVILLKVTDAPIEVYPLTNEQMSDRQTNKQTNKQRDTIQV
jgi:hypothetical protein